MSIILHKLKALKFVKCDIEELPPFIPKHELLFCSITVSLFSVCRINSFLFDLT